MAAPEQNPLRRRVPSLQGGLSSLRSGSQSMLSRSGKDLHSRWPAFPMGQRSKGSFQKASFYLLQQLIHRSPGSDGDDEQEGAESEESSESEMPNLEEEFDGVLREEAVAQALHELGRSGLGTEQVYLNLNLSHCDLIDISILCDYVHLHKLNLSANKIEDLSCVSCMPYLLELNASQNKLTTFFDFKPPKNLKKVDFSSNQIFEMCDLSAYHTLTQLILDNNEIEEIRGLENCISLTHLSLANNKISTIMGLNSLPIKILSLSNNQIEVITGLEDLRALQSLDLSHNQISSLSGLENHNLLEEINLEDNKIADLNEIEYIENLPILRILNLLRNPIQENSEYWYFVIFMLLRLTELDQKKIKVEEKVSSVNKYDPPPEVVAAQDHMTHIVNGVMQPQRIFDSTLPSLDAPYPMLVLAGPEACGKRELAHRLCRQFSTFFRYGACHTTRPPYFGEGDRVDYHFVSQEVFEEMLSMGKFILTFNYGNHYYGLNRDTVEGIARDGLASCIHMEIEGVRSLKCSYFEPRYILIVPMNKEKYEGYLRRKGLFSRTEIEFAVSRVDYYIKINQNYPGYFDAVINADDLDIAYQKLSELIREYLGLTDQSAKNLAPTTAGAPSSKKTASGVPAHLVPSPRRLAKLQAGGQITEHLLEGQTPENQNPAPSQTQELTEGGKHPSSNNHPDSESPRQLSSSTLVIPQQARDTAPKKEEDSRPADLPPKIITTEMDGPEDQAGPPEVPANASGQTSTAASRAPHERPDPPPAPSPRPDQDQESGEAKAAPGDPPSSEPAQGSDPALLNPQTTQDQDEEAAPQDPPEDSPRPDARKKSAGGSQPPPKQKTSKAEVVRAGTPYPDPPPPQDSSTDSKQTADREVVLLPRSRLAPTRLPQPQTLAPLQSRRPTPKLLSPSREEALGTSSDQTPSPRALPAQDGDPSKLPPISPPHSKPPPNPSPHAAPNPQQAQEGKASEVKLPQISPPLQEQAPQHPSNTSQEEEAPTVRLPRIPTPFAEPQLPPNAKPLRGSNPAKERKNPKAGSSASKKIPDTQVSLPSEEQNAARKKKLPTQRELVKKTAPLRKVPPRNPRTAPQPEPHSKPSPSKERDPPDSSSLSSPKQDLGSRTHTEPGPKAAQSQEEKRGKTHPSRKKTQIDLTPKGPAQNVGASKQEPASWKGAVSERSSQDHQTTAGGALPTQEGQPGPAPAQPAHERSAPVRRPGRTEQVHKKGRPLKTEATVEPQEQEGMPPTQQPTARGPTGTGQIGEGSVQAASKQPTKEKRSRKNGGVPQDRNPAAPQNQASAEEVQGSRTGRLRARGSQSTKV